MLEELDRIDWSRLRHANGPATDAPERVRALASADAEVRREAQDWLRDCPPALAAEMVPFLIEILQAPVFPERWAILDYLGGLAFHGRASSASADARAAATAIEQGMDTYAGLLEDGEQSVRIQTARLLGDIGRTDEDVAARVLARLDHEGDPRVRYELLVCLGDIGTPALLPYLIDEVLLASPDPAARWSAASAVTRLCGHESPSEAVAVLDSVLSRPDCRSEVMAVLGWDVMSLVGVTIDGLERVGRHVAGPIFRRALTSLPAWSGDGLLHRLLADARFDPGAPPTRETLTLDQRDLLEYLVGFPDAAWELPGFSRALRDYGLPATREEIELLVGPLASKPKRKRK